MEEYIITIHIKAPDRDCIDAFMANALFDEREYNCEVDAYMVDDKERYHEC